MIPFNLIEYIYDPSRKVITRDGRSVTIKYIDPKDPYPVKAVIDDDEQIITVDINGRYRGSMDSRSDLFFESTLHEKWVSLFKDKDGNYLIDSTLYNSKEEAESIYKGHPHYVRSFELVWEEVTDIK